MNSEIPRPEYPRPQFKRELWQNLNGNWKFDFDEEEKGLAQHWYIDHSYPLEIMVPFVYQSKLSGIHDLRFANVIWYEKEFDLKYSLTNQKVSKVILNFGAVDYYCNVFINECLVGYHEGGSIPFNFDITKYVKENGNKITICVKDPPFDSSLTRGKQTTKTFLDGCFYEKCSGIWQTVWLEYLPEYYIMPNRTFIVVDSNTGNIEVQTELNKRNAHCVLELEIFDTNEENRVKINPECFDCNFNFNGYGTVPVSLKTEIDKEKIMLWYQNNPNLYYAKIKIIDGESDDEDIIDELECYFAFRNLKIEGNGIYINGEELFLKSLLYQGYFPESLLSPPSKEAIIKDLQLTLDMGYNHLRLHQIVADPILIYQADKMGVLLWGEMANAMEYSIKARKNLINEWIGAVCRDRNHPSIIGWVPVNESWGLNDLQNSKEQRDFLRTMYYLTKNLDPSRPVIDNDGWEHVITDIVTVHLYKMPKEISILPTTRPPIGDSFDIVNRIAHKPIFVGDSVYENQPVIITEWGGWGYNFDDPTIKPDIKNAWGYDGILFEDFDEILDLYQNFIFELKKRKSWIKGHCYTEHTDQYQEVNGMLTFDRKPKCKLKKIKEINDSY